MSVKDLAASLPRRAWRTVTWREGSQAELASRFAALRVRPAHRDTLRSEPWPEEWLLIEWPEGAEEPSKYWLSNLPPRTALKDLVHTAKARWLIERDYQELKQEIGLGPLRGPRLARLPPPRQPLHRGLRLPGGRALPFPPSGPLHPRDGSRHLRYPEASGRAVPVRPERHVPHSIATIRRRLTVGLVHLLPRCPCCLQKQPRRARPL